MVSFQAAAQKEDKRLPHAWKLSIQLPQHFREQGLKHGVCRRERAALMKFTSVSPVYPSRMEDSVNYGFLLEKHDNETNHKQSGAADY